MLFIASSPSLTHQNTNTHTRNTYNLTAPSLIVRLFIRRGSNSASSRKQLSLPGSPACAWQQYQKAGEGVLILQRRHAPPTPPVSAHHDEENQADAQKRLQRKQDRHNASPLHPRRVHTAVWKVLEESAERQVDDFEGFKSSDTIESVSPGSFRRAVDRSGPLKWECGERMQK